MNLGLLVLRAVVGLLFAGHGAQKLFGWFGGEGPEATAAMFDRIGLRPGSRQARLAGLAEFGGGLALAFGLLTPFPAAALIGVMTAAIIAVHGANGIWNTNQGFELVMIAAAFMVTAAGPGSASLDNAFGIAISGVGWALLALAAGIAGGASAVASGRAYREEGEEREERHRGAPPHPA